MATLVLKLTDAGLAAVQAASGSDPTVIAGLGLTATPFDYAPTLSALPGEFKRVEVASGIASAANVTHLTAYDTSADVWTATGFGLFLDDGTLFAVHTGAEPVMSKVGLAFALLAFDIAFEADFAANIAYGNAVFAYPAATEQIPGVAEIATQDETNAGDDDRRFVTPKKLWGRLYSIVQAIAAEATSRFNADASLAEAIASEANSRGNADSALGGRIDGEASARAGADAALSDAIGGEATTRSNADNALGGRIDGETTARTNADQALSDAINSEATTRGNADNALGGRIDGETTARTNADQALSDAIGSEATTRSSADSALGNRIDGEASARAGAVTALNEAIGSEANTRGNADSALGTRIDEEATARSGGDSGLQGQIDTLRGRSVAGGGLVSGGGDLSGDRTLTVTEASAADITAGVAGDKVLTPRRLGPIAMLLEQNGFIRFFGFQINWGRFTANFNGTTVVPFAEPMKTACFAAVCSGVTAGGVDSQDNPPAVIVSSINKNGFSVFSADDTADATSYIAVGT